MAVWHKNTSIQMTQRAQRIMRIFKYIMYCNIWNAKWSGISKKLLDNCIILHVIVYVRCGLPLILSTMIV